METFLTQATDVEVSDPGEEPETPSGGRWVTLKFWAIRATLLLLLLLLPGCAKVCEPKQVRCVGLREEPTGADVVQICTSRGRWQTFADCRQIMIGGKLTAGCCTPAGRCVVRP